MIPLPNPFDGDISDDALNDWLAQFDAQDHPVVARLVGAFRYYSSRKVSRMATELNELVASCVGAQVPEVWFVPVGYVAKSGSIIAYYFRTQNNLPQDKFVSPGDVASLQLNSSAALVFIDDFVGSGNQACQVWENVVTPSAGAEPKCRCVYAVLAGYQSGLEKIKKSTGFLPLAVDVLSDDDKPFSSTGTVFQDEQSRESARQLIQKYGARLYPNHPLGYKESQGLLGFFYSTPNNTLPIFWSTEGGWKPILAHGESYRDPAFLIGPPPGLTRESAPESAIRPLAEAGELDKYDIDPDTAIKIFSEFRKAPVFLVLAPVLHQLGIAADAFADLIKLISELKHYEHEKEVVCSALMVVPDEQLEEGIGVKFVSAKSGVTVKSTAEILALANLVNGYRGAVVLRASGDVLGCFLYHSDGTVQSPYLPIPYREPACATLKSNALLFLFLGHGRVTVFHAGRRILSHRSANWHLHTTELDRGIRSLSKDFGIDVPVLQEVFRLALSLSDAGKGAIITVGDHEQVLSFSDPPKTEHLTWEHMCLGDTLDDAVLGLMSQDGATIIAGNGEIIQGMTFLRPPVGTHAEEEVGKGSKHSTAAKMSKVTNAVCLAVSVDGRITVYSNGKILFKMMG